MGARRIVTALLTAALATAGVIVGAGTAAAADQNGGAVTPGVPVTTTISSSTTTVSYTFQATAGRHVTFDVTGSLWNNNNPGQGSVAFKLFDPAGALQKTCAFENAAYYCDVTPASTGTWRAQLVPGVASTGSATWAYWPDQPVTAVTAGTPFTMTAGHQGTQARYSFPATAGRHVTFDTGSSTWSSPAGVRLSFFDPAGAPGLQNCLGGATFCDFTPTVSGTWTVSYVPGNGGTGSVATTFAQDITGPLLTPGLGVTTAIAAEGQNASYPWKPIAGKAATITVSAASWTSGLFAYLQAYDATGMLRASCPVFAGPRTCAVNPATGGDWKVVVDPSGVAVGSQTFSIS